MTDLSFVMTARNDDHGEGFLRRMQVCVQSLLEQLRLYRMNAELVIVEWNPPEDRPLLSRALRRPSETNPVSIRFLQVPHHLHRTFKHSDQLPLLQMRAKNVGIRRAKGEFVAVTNADILFSERLMRFLASRRLQTGRMYRVDRLDVPDHLSADWSLQERLQYCNQNVLRRHNRYATVHDPQSWLKRLLTWWDCRNEYPLKRHIHTHGSGDFTLMAKRHWEQLQGYPELDCRAINVDALLCFMAHFGPAPEKFLGSSHVVFHMDHRRMEGDANISPNTTDAVPTLDWEQVYRWGLSMSETRRPMIFNDENWGLGKEILKEEIL
jgi:hypothetical protein